MGETLLTARKFTVERREYNIPGVGMVVRDLVVHPGAVLIVPVLSSGEVVLIRNFRYAAGQKLLELPAGTLEPPEPPIKCAARELEEETGYITEALEPLCKFYTTPGFTDEFMHVFVSSGLTAKQQRLEATEQIEVAVTSFDDALAATLDGRIIDAKTIAALHIYNSTRRGTS